MTARTHNDNGARWGEVGRVKYLLEVELIGLGDG